MPRDQRHTSPTTSVVNGKKFTPIMNMPIPPRPPIPILSEKAKAHVGPLDLLLSHKPLEPLAPPVTSNDAADDEFIVVDEPSLEEIPQEQFASKSALRNALLSDQRPNSQPISTTATVSSRKLAQSSSVHSFFKPPKKTISVVIHIDDDDIPSDSGTRHAPIDISESPQRPGPPAQPLKKSRAKAAVPNGNDLISAPWPTGDMQHVRGLLSPRPPMRQSTFISTPRPRGSSHQPFSTSLTSNSAPSSSLSASPHTLYKSLHPLRPSSTFSIPLEHLNHPALSRLSPSTSPSTSRNNQDAWVDKFRPTRTAHLLGNEQNGQYIKEWLLALELSLEPTRGEASHASQIKPPQTRGTKRPRPPAIIRTVDKKTNKRRKKNDWASSEDWIARSDDEEDTYVDVHEQEGDNDEFLLPSSSTPQLPVIDPSISNTTYNFSKRLTNVLLLSGPPGVGKTAAVYACAAELGDHWDVFETNPGAGKRTGANIAAMFDGVGKNHTLGVGPGDSTEKGKKKQKNGTERKVGAGGTLESMFAKVAVKKVGAENEPIDLVGFDSEDVAEIVEDGRKSVGFMIEEDEQSYRPPGTPSSDTPSQPVRKVNQSIVLLEEVDVLFLTDTGFWNAVVNFIKCSRRPIIMTCNGMSLASLSYAKHVVNGSDAIPRRPNPHP